MSIYPNVTQQDLINLSKLVEQQKNPRAPEIEIRILKYSHDIKVAENLSPIGKKLEEYTETKKKLVDIINGSNSGNDKNQDEVPVELMLKMIIFNLIKELFQTAINSLLRRWNF